MSEREREFLVEEHDAGQRLDRWLATRMPERSRATVQRWIRDGRVRTPDALLTKPSALLEAPARVHVTVPEDAARAPGPERIELRVLFEDDHLVAVDKPAGMVTHPGHGHASGTLVNALLGRGTTLAAIGSPDRPGIVHRLDRGTSGVLVVAKTDEAHLGLAARFAARQMDKTYLALVWGRPAPEEGTVRRRIGRSRNDRLKMSVRSPSGKEAVTSYRTRRRLPGFALLECLPETGRTHQIRVHLQSIHHPIVGDDRYGGRGWRGVEHPRKRAAIRDFERLALHARELAFDHPITGERVSLHADLPADFAALLATLDEAPP